MEEVVSWMPAMMLHSRLNHSIAALYRNTGPADAAIITTAVAVVTRRIGRHCRTQNLHASVVPESTVMNDMMTTEMSVAAVMPVVVRASR